MDSMMESQSIQPKSPVELGIWTRPSSGEEENGDCYLVKTHGDNVVIGVADGLGHGKEASHAARIAMECIDSHAGDSLISLFRCCHEELKNTRGAVMSLASFHTTDNTMSWVGVGNVAGVLIRAGASPVPQRETILLRGGVVGLNLPQLYATEMAVYSGDTLVFATDGISRSFADNLSIQDSPQHIAEEIGSHFAVDTDDALVVVARYRGQTNAK
jgi:negative regulator of sigma-B (phosphoserine phosphatase)